MSELSTQILDIVTHQVPEIPREVWNLASGEHRSSMFFGGIVKYIERGPILDEEGEPLRVKCKKSINYGEIKTKLYTKEVRIEGLGISPQEDWKLAKDGYFSTEGKVLQALSKECELAQLLTTYRKLETIKVKYYKGYPDLTYERDGCIHCRFSIDTVTGRNTCKTPNLQQVPRDKSVKPMFTSRFGKRGKIIQGDFSQLEFRGSAYLSQDPEMISDIYSGLDIHKQSASWAFEISEEYITKEQRTEGKKVTFGPLYGQGIYGLHNNSGLPIESCKAFLKSFYEKYSRLKQWQEERADEIRNNQQGEWSYIKGPSGRICWLEEGEAPDFMKQKGIFKSFKPTEYKNYPVQSIAGDILIIQRGILFRKLLPFRGKCCIVNTVHDSVILDCHKDVVEEVTEILKDTLEDVTAINKVFSREFNVPLTVDISIGNNWGELE